jgi:hypothetical protein
LFVGAGLRQQIVLQKIDYRMGSCSLGLRVQLRSPRPNCLPRTDYDAHDQCEEYRSDPRYQHLVALRELSQLVAGAGRLGRNWTVFQIAPDIGGELHGRSVTPRFVFFESLGDDGLDVPAIRAVDRTQRFGINLLNRLHHLVDVPRHLVG